MDNPITAPIKIDKVRRWQLEISKHCGSLRLHHGWDGCSLMTIVDEMERWLKDEDQS